MSENPYPHRALKLAAVSTKPQVKRKRKTSAGEAVEDRFSIPHQLATCNAAIERHAGWVDVGEVVIPGHSRRYDFLDELCAACPEYAGLIRRIQAREATVLVVAYDDRAFRGTILAPQLAVVCARHSVQIYNCQQPVEPVAPDEFALTALDKLMYSFRGFAAESYVEAIAAKTYEAKVEKVKSGLAIMSRPLYGWSNPGDGRPFQQVPEQVRWLRWMRERRVNDLWGWVRLAGELNALGVRTGYGNQWCRVTVRRVLNDLFHAGWVKWGDVQARGQHEPIFSDAEFAELEAVNAMLADRYTVSHRAGEFSGLCKCAICGRNMVYSRHRTELRCGAYNDGRSRPRSHSNRCLVRKLREALIEEVRRVLGNLDKYIAYRQQAAAGDNGMQLEQVERQLAAKAREAERWAKAYAAEVIPLSEFKRRRQESDQAIAALERERQSLLNEQARREAIASQIQALAPSQADLDALLDSLPRLSEERRRWVYQQLFAEIRLKSGERPDVVIRR